MDKGLKSSNKREVPREGSSLDVDDNSNSLDFDPTHFLRCHSKKNDTADVQTQVS